MEQSRFLSEHMKKKTLFLIKSYSSHLHNIVQTLLHKCK